MDQGKQSYHPKKERVTRTHLYSLLFYDPDKLSDKNKGILYKLMEAPKARELYSC